MKKFLIIFFALFFFLQSFAQPEKKTSLAKEDTSGKAVVLENAIIDEIVETRQAPAKDKVQYFSQQTRYGFKNLFSKYSYNSTLPYSSQINPNAESYMQDYLKLHSKGLLKMKDWGMPYFNLIDNIFSQYGLPKELKYLAVIESNLSTAATSWVGAGGPWQFMPYTARNYGLVVNSSYDERRDYYKSTHAAARYLLTLYKQMNRDWLLVIAAYNGGPGRVFSAMKRSGSKDFWALQYYLPQESRNHVKKFIATHYIMEGTGGITTTSQAGNSPEMAYMNGAVSNPYDNKPSLTDDEKAQSATQTVSGKYSAAVIAKNLSMEMTLFNKYNPQFDYLINSNGQFELTLPSDKMQLFLATRYQILNECVQILMSDDNIPNNKTVYPAKYGKPKKKG